MKISVAGHTVEAVSLTGVTSTVGKTVSKLTVAPVTIDGTKYGATTVTPKQGSKTVSAPSLPASAPANVLSVSSPVLKVSASAGSSGPKVTVGSETLGGASVLSLPISIDGSADLLSSVTSSASTAKKELVISGLSLPSIADLLGALGLDLSALPVSTLDALLTQLGLPATGLDDLDSAVDAAQTAAGSSIDRLRDAQAAVSDATDALGAANDAFDTAEAALQTALDSLSPLELGGLDPLSVEQYQALNSTVKDALKTAKPAIGTAETALDAADTAAVAAKSALAQLQDLLDAIQQVADMVTGVLDDTPLVSLGKVDVSTLASAGTQLAAKVTGQVSGIKVLGTDVLDTALGSSSIDVLDLVGDKVDQVNAEISSLTDTLHTVLSSVPGVGDLSIPAPVVEVMKKTTKTSKSTSVQQALASVMALKVTIPSFSIPSAVAIPNAVTSLPGLSTVSGLLTTPKLVMAAGNLSEAAVVNTASSSVSSPGKNNRPGLASTGLPAGLATTALVAVGAAVLVRRRMAAQQH